MRVQCIRLADVQDTTVTHSAWLTVGKEYEVFGISVATAHSPKFQIASDGRDNFHGLSWHTANLFDLVDPSIPSNWSLAVSDSGALHFAPVALQEPGLWERFFDGDQGARTLVETELGLAHLESR